MVDSKSCFADNPTLLSLAGGRLERRRYILNQQKAIEIFNLLAQRLKEVPKLANIVSPREYFIEIFEDDLINETDRKIVFDILQEVSVKITEDKSYRYNGQALVYSFDIDDLYHPLIDAVSFACAQKIIQQLHIVIVYGIPQDFKLLTCQINIRIGLKYILATIPCIYGNRCRYMNNYTSRLKCRYKH